MQPFALNVVEPLIEPQNQPSMTSLSQAGGGFEWLAEEPDLYTDADLAGAQD